MRKLNIGRIGFCKVVVILEMLVHGIYQAVSNRPQCKQKSNQEENEGVVSSVFSGKKTFFCFFHMSRICFLIAIWTSLLQSSSCVELSHMARFIGL